MDAHPMFGGGGTESVISPIVLVALGLTVILVFLLPRRWVIVPFLCFTFLTPLGQLFYVAGVHIFALRIVILAGFIRLIGSQLVGEGSALGGGFNGVDRAFFGLAVVQAVGFVIITRRRAQ
jgi:hypothetical protein